VLSSGAIFIVLVDQMSSNPQRTGNGSGGGSVELSGKT
jgi:hypothetical protein